MYGNDSLMAPRCYCRELTAGVCAVCAAHFTPPPPPQLPPISFNLTITGTDELLAKLRKDLAELTRKHAALEAGPVGVRLRQIADAFEGAEEV